ncbi:hypothetical protein SKAU_G00052800 [Synaphobranchus kaupii]|uniref:Uncharacterized protein n=1 Tax=Synaphobranchus kaupii TaxID=118154 RepID=A0A9Q1J9Y1_SYNKA|nr:hypothetical protein SKAU_G00052800 [Synaphobranchus kaupii]
MLKLTKEHHRSQLWARSKLSQEKEKWDAEQDVGPGFTLPPSAADMPTHVFAFKASAALALTTRKGVEKHVLCTQGRPEQQSDEK